MKKIRNKSLVILILVLVSFCYTKTYSQEKKNNSLLFDFSIDFTNNRGILRDINFEIYPNFGVRVLKKKNFELHTKVGVGIRMVPFLEREIFSTKINVEAFIGRKKHYLVVGGEYIRVASHGKYCPIFMGYRYQALEDHSVMILYKPLLWLSCSTWDGCGYSEENAHWLWEQYSYTGYAVQLSYYFHF